MTRGVVYRLLEGRAALVVLPREHLALAQPEEHLGTYGYTLHHIWLQPGYVVAAPSTNTPASLSRYNLRHLAAFRRRASTDDRLLTTDD